MAGWMGEELGGVPMDQVEPSDGMFDVVGCGTMSRPPLVPGLSRLVAKGFAWATEWRGPLNP